MTDKLEKSVNAVTVSGMLQDAVVRYTKTGDPVANATLVVIEGTKDGTEKRQFLRIVAWRGLAEKASGLRQSSKVRIVGRLETATWEKDGERKSRLQIVCDSLEPVSSLREVPSDVAKERPAKPTVPRKIGSGLGGMEAAAAILSPAASSAITPENPISDADVPW